MNAQSSPGLKKRHQCAAQEVLDEIADLERKWEACKGYPTYPSGHGFIVRANDIMIVEDADYETVETWGGESRKVQTGIEAPISLTWIDYHDQLVKEWFDGERKLVDDLYPNSPPRLAKKKSDLPITVAIAIPMTMFIVLWVWMAKQMFGF